MDSKRRMIELHIWDDPGFNELGYTEKLQYWFVLTRCDNVGVYRHSPKLESFHCGKEIELQSFIETLNFDQERIKKINNGSLWIKDFVRDTWGTIAAGNNLGVSCYKLLVKHGLLEQFISEFPNSINVGSFRDAITENKLDLPLPQSSPKPAPENCVSKEYEGQGSPRAGTINNNINKGINNNKDISISNSPSVDVEQALNPTPSLSYFNIAKALKKIIPKRLRREESDISFESRVKKCLESLDDSVKDPKQVMLNRAKSMDWDRVTLDDYFTGLAIEESPF